MSEFVFQDLPQVDLLQWLARGSLKQKLLRTIRLWVWLRSIYGGHQECLMLDDGFTYTEWRDAFFSPTHTKGEEIPHLHDSRCACAKTTAQWLFNENTGIFTDQWQELLIAHTGITESKLDEILQQRLFAVTRRSLHGDLQVLVNLHWLIYRNDKYYRVIEFPARPIAAKSDDNYELNFLHEDLVGFAENHSQKINGVQRFFLKLDYITPRSNLDAVDDWQHQLRELWTKTLVAPIQLTYKSAKVGNKVNCIVYPVCIYYIQRAVYLCAYGESPDIQNQWYNFRLDHIQKIQPLTWDNAKIPVNLQQDYQRHTLPTPDYVALEMSKAWGFDFYLPAQLMLLRFDRDFGDRYVKGTERHETFQEISYEQVQKLIKQKLTESTQQQALLKVLANRSSEDAYYQVFIRYQDAKNRDNNVMMRLRAWRPKCEVIFPDELRQSIAADVAQEFQLYHQD